MTTAPNRRVRSIALLPGLALCAAVAAAAYGTDALEARLFGRAWLEPLVLAILIGAAVRAAWAPPHRFERGIAFSAKTLLEAAVVLLGLSIGAGTVVAAGPALVGSVGLVVVAAIALSYGIGRGFGLSHRMAVLIACGTSICGNSAIAATGPAIRADRDDVAAAISFTAVFGVGMVLLLPLAAVALHLSQVQYGIFAGLTVYAVPQVLAATAPVGVTSVQVGTLVKLLRVMMLGPVVLVLSVTDRGGAGGGAADAPRRGLAPLRLVPPFILGFAAMVAVRSTGLVPPPALGAASAAAGVLTVAAMAALGLSVELRAVAAAGARVAVVVVASLAALGAVSLALIAALGAG